MYFSGAADENCWSVNYISRRICALEGSSVNISSEYSHPDSQKPKLWYKRKWGSKEEAERLIAAPDEVEFHDNMKNFHTLTIQNVKMNNSAEYTFRFLGLKQSDVPGVTLIITGNYLEYM